MRTVFPDGSAAPLCAQYLVTVQPRPGYGAAECGGASCTFGCADQTVWFWQRILNGTSPASLAIQREDGCCPCVPRKWHDELAFWRLDPDGSPRLKWIGPVADVIDDTTSGTLTINALDRSAWLLDERLIPQGVSGITEEAAIRWERLWKLTDQLDPVFLDLVRYGGLSGITISDDVAQWAGLGPELQKLQAFGVSWTVVGDRILFGDLTAPLTSEPIDPAVHWQSGGAIVSDLGSSSITNLLLQTDEFSILYPPGLTPDPCEGLHIDRFSPDFDLSRDQAQAYAIREFERRSRQGLSVQTSVDSSISEQWPISMCDMRPGGTMTVDTRGPEFCLGTVTEAQLQDMTVEGSGCVEEAVKVSLRPEGGVSEGINVAQ